MPTPKKRDSVIDKVRKLLALADSEGGGTPAERALAADRAAELMTKHDLDLIDLGDPTARDDVGQEQDRVDGMTEQWRGHLRGRVAAAMGGDYYYTRLGRAATIWHYVGRPDTIAFVRALTDSLIPWLEIECEAALTKAIAAGETGTCSRCDGVGETRRVIGGGYTADLHECPTCNGTGTVPLSGRVFRREFYDAASRRIAARLKKQRAQTANAAAGKGTSTALVKHDRAGIEAYYKQAGIKLTSVSASTTGGAHAGRAHGADAGDRANLAAGRGVSAGRGALPKAS
jgi:hypothetical protein